MAIFNGSGVALVTPFNENGINYDVLKEQLEFIIAGGSKAVTVLGTTGEPSTMTLEEKNSVIKFCIKTVNKRIPVIVGSGGNNTAVAIEASMKAESLGANALLIVTPYYNKCTQNGLIAHYKAISDKVNIPIIVYNVPGRTGLNIAPATAAKLAEIKNIKAIKEASGNIEQIMEVARLTKGKLDLYSGDDNLIVPIMSLGGIGVISVAANIIPDKIEKIVSLCSQNKFSEATALQFELTPFIKTLFCEVNPIPAKKALQYLGLNVGLPRLPLTEMETENAVKLKTEMQKFGLIK